MDYQDQGNLKSDIYSILESELDVETQAEQLIDLFKEYRYGLFLRGVESKIKNKINNIREGW